MSTETDSMAGEGVEPAWDGPDLAACPAAGSGDGRRAGEMIAMRKLPDSVLTGAEEGSGRAGKGTAKRRQGSGLGADSLTWRNFGDWGGLLVALWAGSLQNMHPGLGAGVEYHSEFFKERHQRLFRSLYPINGVVYDGERAPLTATQVRQFHVGIKGVDGRGRRYSALDPDTFYWAHATFFMSIITYNEYFGARLGPAEKEKLYAEHVEWYRLYGLSMKPVPADWVAFQAYWDHMCKAVLEDTSAARDVLNLSALPKPPGLRLLPDSLWRRVSGYVASGQTWITVGLYHPAVRDRLGYRWTDEDERKLRRLGAVVRNTWGRLPMRWRMHPRARAGWDRASGRISRDTPLVETPERNLPPQEARNDPKHYCPV